MLFGKRLGIGHVEGSAGDTAALQRVDQSVGLNGRAATDVDEDRVRAHGGKLCCSEDAASLSGERQSVDDILRFLQEGGELTRSEHPIHARYIAPRALER